MCKQVYHTQYGTVDYKEQDNVVLLTWKKKCSYDDYRNTALSALNTLQHYNNSNFVIDARNGFEDEAADVQWGFDILLPAMAKTTCRYVIFIMETVNDIEGEMDMWSKEFSKYFTVKKVNSYTQAVSVIKNK